MKTIDRIRKYIKSKIDVGEIVAGSKLPSYRELGDICGGSYVTVRSAVVKLQNEGLVEIRNGSGTYLAGGKKLKIRLNINSSALPVKRMRRLLDKHLAETDLNLELDVYPLSGLNESQALKTEKAMISILQSGESINLPPVTLDKFSGYAKLAKMLKITDKVKSRIMLPFTTYNYQIGISRAVWRKVGFKQQRLDNDFNWWSKYASCCRQHGIYPVSQHWHPKTTWRFSLFYGLLLSLTDCGIDGLPVFDSAGGRRFLEIIRDTYFHPSIPDSKAFFGGGAGMSFCTGSWISRQNFSKERPDITVNELKILPFNRNGRRIFPSSANYLQGYLSDDLRPDERKRVWSLICLMLGREFQLDYCNLAGMISPRKDISPEEYSWNRNRQWDVFIPGKDDLVVYDDQLLAPSANAALSILLEDFCFYGADMETTLRRMELKKDTERFGME